MRILFATNNRHKLAELQAILRDDEVICPADIGLAADVEETGNTFLENALLKANAVRALTAHGELSRTGNADTGLIVVADDSGLCVDALGGRPGIYSARYGSAPGETVELSSSQRNELLLQELDPAEQRSARFVCCMVAVLSDHRILTAEESWEGEIAKAQARASGGFGYDPVFYLPGHGCTAAELPAETKNALSHRGRAATVLAAGLRAANSLP